MCSKQKNKVNSRRTFDEIDTCNLPDKEFKVMVTKMVTKLRRIMDEYSENFNKKTENIRMSKIKIIKLKNPVTEWETRGIQQQSK